MEYPAPGLPGLADEISDLVRPTWVGKDTDSWGLDHGTWSVLHHMFPDADVPVVQLSIDATKSFDEHLALGGALAPLCERGVLVLGSGNVVHNLARIKWDSPDAGEDWARRFDEHVREIMTRDPAALAAVAEHPDFALAVPTPEHFIPLLYIAGVASARGTTASTELASYAMGSLSMTSYFIE